MDSQEVQRREIEDRIEHGKAFLALQAMPEWSLTFGKWFDAQLNAPDVIDMRMCSPESVQSIYYINQGRRYMLNDILGLMVQWRRDGKAALVDELDKAEKEADL